MIIVHDVLQKPNCFYFAFGVLTVKLIISTMCSISLYSPLVIFLSKSFTFGKLSRHLLRCCSSMFLLYLFTITLDVGFDGVSDIITSKAAS
ncbi:hypothetical protein BDC45DRAFT_504353, partial [Circinella umbellata]